MSTIRILLVIICLAVISCHTEPDGRTINRYEKPVKQGHMENDSSRPLSRKRLVVIARSQLGVVEATGHNDGRAVEAYLEITRLPKGNPWCAAFISWVYWKGGYKKPCTAWSPALFPLSRHTLRPQPADVLGIYSVRLKRIAHAGLMEFRHNNWIVSIEGNTNGNGSREGDGVYRKRRHIKTIARFADWLQHQSDLP